MGIFCFLGRFNLRGLAYPNPEAFKALNTFLEAFCPLKTARLPAELDTFPLFPQYLPNRKEAPNVQYS